MVFRRYLLDLVWWGWLLGVGVGVGVVLCCVVYVLCLRDVMCGLGINGCCQVGSVQLMGGGEYRLC